MMCRRVLWMLFLPDAGDAFGLGEIAWNIGVLKNFYGLVTSLPRSPGLYGELPLRNSGIHACVISLVSFLHHKINFET